MEGEGVEVGGGDYKRRCDDSCRRGGGGGLQARGGRSQGCTKEEEGDY